MLRQRDSIGTWSKFTTFRTFYGPTDIASDSLRTYPNIVYSTEDFYPLLTDDPEVRWDDKVRISWNDPTTKMVGITRQGTDQFSPSREWRMYDLLQPSMEPAMPTVSHIDSVVQPLMYRSPTMNAGTGLYDARVTHMDFPITSVQEITRPVARISTNTSSFLCSSLMSGSMGDVKLSRKDSMHVDTMGIDDGPKWALQPYDGSVDDPITWNDDRLRTQNFLFYDDDTIRYERFFHVGAFEEGDTTDAKDELYDSSDYVKIRVLLRNSIDDSFLALLDSCIVTKLGFFQSAASMIDTTRMYISSKKYNDSVYVSLEACRGNVANNYEVFATMAYNDELIDAIPQGDEGAYKRANPNPLPTASSGVHRQLSVTVNPNPFRGNTTVTVETVQGMPMLIEIYDLLGKRLGTVYKGISEQEKGWFTIGRETLSPGTYFIRVQAGSEVVSRKIELLR